MLKQFLLLLAGLSLANAALAVEPLNWVGCGITKKAFMAELAVAFEKKTGIPIDIHGGGATRGIRMVADNKEDFGGSCRPRLPGNLQEAAAQLNPVAWDALTVIVNPANPVDSISTSNLKHVLEGKITNWKELGGEDKPIHLMVRKSHISGVGWTLRQLIFSNPDQKFISKYQFPSSGPLEKAVETDPLAIGVTGVSSAHKRKVKELELDGKAPNYANIRDGAYLLYRPLYITYNSSGKNYAEVMRFIDFAQSPEGRAIIRKTGSVPYLDALGLVHKQQQQWKVAYDRIKKQDRAAALVKGKDRK